MSLQLKVVNINPLEGNTIAPPLQADSVVTLQGVHICTCGQHHYNVGLASKVAYVSCYSCKKELPDGDTIHWCHPSRFTNAV